MQITKNFIVTEPDNPRKMGAKELADLLQKEGANVIAKPLAEEACAQADTMKEQYDVILYAGSLYLIGKVRSILRNA